MYSMEQRIPLGAPGHDWFILIGIDYVDGLYSHGSMLAGMSSIMETFPKLIEGFEIHPLDSSSTLPVLSSNHLEDSFPQQSAVLMFKYFHVTNKMNPWGTTQLTSKPTTGTPSWYDDDAEYKPSNTMWGTSRVWTGENIKEAMEVWLWVLHSTSIQVWWKAHQSADSSAFIQIMCCPNLFDKDGLSKEIVCSLKEVELKMIQKGVVSADLVDKPIPPLLFLWCQSSQGRARYKNKKLLSLNNLPCFVQNGCLILTIKMEEGTWVRLGPLWKMLNKMGLSHWIFGQKMVIDVLFGGKLTQSDRNTIQRLHWCNVMYADTITSLVLSHSKLLHKQVEVRMEDTSVTPPYKYTNLGRETLTLLMELLEDDLWYGKEVFAFDAMALISLGINSGGATITYRVDSAYSVSLAKKIRKCPPAW
jgi:hypothetical protein